MTHRVLLKPTTRLFPTFLLAICLMAGCTDDVSIPLDPPPGWEGHEDRWWRLDVDTTGAFRNLETMADMGIAGSNMLSVMLTGNTSTDRELARLKVIQLVKESLIELFRNKPETVDSLFNQFVAPQMAGLTADRDFAPHSDLTPLVKQYQKSAYMTLGRHFRRPVTVLKLVEDIPIPIPDSLKESGHSGTTLMQVAINKEGIPFAIERIESAHPVLDAIAMRATTQMRWQPAYVLTKGRTRPVQSWARFNIRFDLE